MKNYYCIENKSEPTACPHCKALDDKVFEVKDAMPGENAPPMHPFAVAPPLRILMIRGLSRQGWSYIGKREIKEFFLRYQKE